MVGGVAWVGAHDLDPRKPIASTVKPVTVQVVSLDWKWLFIYPDQGIASVNHLTIPVGTPVSFELTSSGVMNSFFVPQLGSQIYTMAGMATHLHLQADHPGTYPGLSANFSGDGFADMRFTVDAVPAEQFAQWVSATRNGGPVLDAATYAELAKPSQAVAPFTYRARSRPTCSSSILSSSGLGRTISVASPIRHHRGQKNESPWQAQLERDPVRSADRHGRIGGDGPGHRGRSLGGSPLKGILALPVARVDHHRSTTSASASCTSCWRWSCCCAAFPTRS